MIKTTTKQLRYATYSRCSTDDQSHKDFSTIDVQETLNSDYVRHASGRLVDNYKDDGVSGTTIKRPGFQRLLRDAQAGLYDVVVCTYMSRLGRGKIFVIAEYELEKCGVRVEMVREQFTDDLAGYMGQSMTILMDGVYPKMVSQWTKTKMEQMVAHGYHCGGVTPLGYLKVIDPSGEHKPGKEPPKRLIADPDIAPIIRQAFETFAQLGNLAAVREYLNSATDRQWTTTRAREILTNEVYRGVQQFGKWRNVEAHEAIIDLDLWTRAAARLGEHGLKWSARSTDDPYVYYLRGKVRCPHCGCPCTQSAHRGRNGMIHYYTCLTTNKRGVCPVGRLNADKVHATVLATIARCVSSKSYMHKLIAQSEGWSDADQALLELRGQLARQKQAADMRASNYVKAIGEGRLSTALLSALEKVEAERESIVDQLESVRDRITASTFKRPTAEQVQACWRQLPEAWADLDEAEREEVMSAIVQAVELTDKKSVTLELLPFPSPHSEWFASSHAMGAGSQDNANRNNHLYRSIRTVTPLVTHYTIPAY